MFSSMVFISPLFRSCDWQGKDQYDAYCFKSMLGTRLHTRQKHEQDSDKVWPESGRLLSLRAAGPATVKSQMRHPFLVERRLYCARQSLASTLSAQARRRHININVLVQLALGQTQFVPGHKPGLSWNKPSFSPCFTHWSPVCLNPVCPWDKQGSKGGRKSSCVNSLCAFFARYQHLPSLQYRTAIPVATQISLPPVCLPLLKLARQNCSKS